MDDCFGVLVTRAPFVVSQCSSSRFPNCGDRCCSTPGKIAHPISLTFRKDLELFFSDGLQIPTPIALHHTLCPQRLRVPLQTPELTFLSLPTAAHVCQVISSVRTDFKTRLSLGAFLLAPTQLCKFRILHLSSQRARMLMDEILAVVRNARCVE